MRDKPRLFIGTMYSGENEFEECREMIFAQTYKNFEHFVYKDLNYKDAHDALYNEFMSKANEFDIMIKVDADMVIREKTFFEWVVQKFQKDAELDMLSMALHDFYMDDLIWGMHAYRNTVKWSTGNEIVYTDRMHAKDTIRKTELHWDKVADHCKNPSEIQAFHFGFHRALKAVQPGRIKARLDGNWKKMELVYKNFLRNKDRRIAFALAGTEELFSHYYKEENISYNEEVEQIYEKKFRDKSIEQLENFIKRKRFFRFAYLGYPYDYGYKFYCFRIISFIRR